MKIKVLNWAKQFSTFCMLDNHLYAIEPHTEECIIGAGIRRELRLQAGHALPALQSFIREEKSWLFGHLGYDLKNEIENLTSSGKDNLLFPDVYFFEPEVIIQLTKKTIHITAAQPEKVYEDLCKMDLSSEEKNRRKKLQVQSRLTKEEYVKTIEALQKHIVRGDCYEINFCNEFFATDALIDPLSVYQQLTAYSPNPFAAIYRLENKWLLCASPERYLGKKGKTIFSQPIKGTSKRMSSNINADEENKRALRESRKEQAENVMVVDLVRNDLSKICEEGSVKVDELFGIYSFPQVHQMISTISGTLQEKVDFASIIRATFPMGSMTGAPKKRVMELIEQYEITKRGIFSGSVGYLTPEGDFDLNVVIRSILYNADKNYLSFPAGSGITFYSQPEKEWEECLMKAEAMKKVLE